MYRRCLYLPIAFLQGAISPQIIQRLNLLLGKLGPLNAFLYLSWIRDRGVGHERGVAAGTEVFIA